MSKILFVWELGSAYGHTTRLLATAGMLADHGHAVAIAVRELHNLPDVLADSRVEVFQSPVWLSSFKGAPEPPVNYPEILLRYGYHDAGCLHGLVQGWLGLYRNYRPDVIVASHAPTALLAARIAGVRAMTLGSCFACPPRQAPMPNMRPWMSVTEQRLAQSEVFVLGSTNRVLLKYSAPPLSVLHELFDIADNLLCTFPELDHYGERKDVNYCGPIFRTDLGEAVPWPAGADKRVFVYLKAGMRDFPAIVQTLAQMEVAAIICAPGVSEQARAHFSGGSIHISGKPVRLDHILESCDLAINTASTSTTAAMLLAGVPCLLLAEHLEQYLLAGCVAATGSAVVVKPDGPVPDYPELLPKTLADVYLPIQAARFAERHADFDPAAQQRKIAARIMEIAAG
jgi:UDP:flavonoid glycosyltransferase YjiC (YdhE family)